MTDITVAPGRARARRSRLWMLAGLAPGVLWQITFFVVPLALLSVYSFWSMKNYRVDYTFTLKNYTDIFQSPLLLNALILSLKIALVVTLACGILAYPIAYFIAKKAGRWRTLCLIMVIIPFWTSFILRAYAWKLLLGDHGFINTGLSMVGVIDKPIGYLLYSPFATSIGLIYAFLPFYIMPLYSSIDKVHDSWLAAAQDLGAPPTKAFFEVTFPLCLPGLVVGAVFTFIFAVGDYVVPQLLGGGKSLLIAQAIVFEFETSQNWPGGAALSVVLLAIILVLLVGLLRWVRMDEIV